MTILHTGSYKSAGHWAIPMRFVLMDWAGSEAIYNWLWINTEGTKLSNGPLEDTDVQLLYGRLIAPFWDLQGGVRYFRPRRSRIRTLHDPTAGGTAALRDKRSRSESAGDGNWPGLRRYRIRVASTVRNLAGIRTLYWFLVDQQIRRNRGFRESERRDGPKPRICFWNADVALA